MAASSRTLKQIAYQQLKEFLVIALYLWVVFGLFVTVILACFKILEDATIGLYHGQSFHQSIADLAGGTWKGILTLTVLLFAVLIPAGRIRRTAKSPWQRQIGADLFPLASLGKPSKLTLLIFVAGRGI